MINFLRALSAAERARQMSALVEPDPWLVAPDFVYRTLNGESRSLKDHRGNEIVMLVLFSLPESRARLAELEGASPQLQSKNVKILAIPREIEQVLQLNRRSNSCPWLPTAAAKLSMPMPCCAEVFPSRARSRIRPYHRIWSSSSIARAMCARVGFLETVPVGTKWKILCARLTGSTRRNLRRRRRMITCTKRIGRSRRSKRSSRSNRSSRALGGNTTQDQAKVDQLWADAAI